MTWRDPLGWRGRTDHHLTSSEALRELRARLGPPTPRLRIRRDPIFGQWCWWVTPFPTRTLGYAATHAEALAVGLAALEAASVERISP